MVNRIRQLLEARQLTPTQFADVIGVARPIVSHILSGRNKPSLEVVQRILAAMPDLAMSWLLNGTGPMLALPAGSSSPVLDDAPTMRPEKKGGAPPEARLKPSTQPPLPTAKAGALAAQASMEAPVAVAPRATATQSAPKRFATSPSALGVGQATEVQGPTPTVSPASSVTPLTPVADMPGTLPAASAAGTDKRIRRIVIFYQDGSFADFQPE